MIICHGVWIVILHEKLMEDGQAQAKIDHGDVVGGEEEERKRDGAWTSITAISAVHSTLLWTYEDTYLRSYLRKICDLKQATVSYSRSPSPIASSEAASSTNSTAHKQPAARQYSHKLRISRVRLQSCWPIYFMIQHKRKTTNGTYHNLL